MKPALLDRYELDANGRVVIDVAASRTEDLYEHYDRSAPYIRRDLDSDLVDYLTACAREVRPEPFVFRFSLDQPPDNEKESRIRGSVRAYFVYLAEVERQKAGVMVRRSATLLGIGLVILAVSVSVNDALGPERSVVADVFGEGLTVAAWVSLWEALAIFLIDWFPHRRTLALYRRLADTPLVLRRAIRSGS